MISISAILAVITAGGLPAIGAVTSVLGSGVLGLVGTFLRPGSIKKYLIIFALIGLVGAAVGVTLWIKGLEATREKYVELVQMNKTLATDMGCPDGNQLVTCLAKQRLELAKQHSDEVEAATALANQERDRIAEELARAEDTLKQWDKFFEKHAASDRPLSPYMVEFYRELRSKEGFK